MKNATLRFTNDYIVFENFEEVEDEKDISVNIYGNNRRVTILPRVPVAPELLPCHNVIKIHNRRCHNPDLIKKLKAAGVESGEQYFFVNGFYLPLRNDLDLKQDILKIQN